MPEGSVITDEMRATIGIESEPSIFEIEKEPIRRWADAIQDANRLYHDEAYAKKTLFGGLIAPPGMIGNYQFPVKEGKPGPGIQPPFVRILNGGNEFEYFLPAKAGDVLSATTKIASIFERQGGASTGRMLFVVRESTYKNQRGETVAKTRNTLIHYEGPTG